MIINLINPLKKLFRRQTKEDQPITQIETLQNKLEWDHKHMKSPGEKSQSGRWNQEAKEICPCCHKFMRKQSIRTYWNKKAGWWPTSWICLKCGYMKLDEKRFKVVEES